MFNLKVSPEMGRGLYANRVIEPGEIIMDCEILVLSPLDTSIVSLTDLKYYTFIYNEKQDCLVLGLGEIFNHADQPNVSFQLVDHEDRKIMRFTALASIMPGSQLFINYNADTNVNIDSYVNNPSMVG